jgi:hypothetical protein
MSLEVVCLHGTRAGMHGAMGAKPSSVLEAMTPFMEDPEFESVHFNDVARAIDLGGSCVATPPPTHAPSIALRECPSLETTSTHVARGPA